MEPDHRQLLWSLELYILIVAKYHTFNIGYIDGYKYRLRHLCYNAVNKNNSTCKGNKNIVENMVQISTGKNLTTDHNWMYLKSTLTNAFKYPMVIDTTN